MEELKIFNPQRFSCSVFRDAIVCHCAVSVDVSLHEVKTMSVVTVLMDESRKRELLFLFLYF